MNGYEIDTGKVNPCSVCGQRHNACTCLMCMCVDCIADFKTSYLEMLFDQMTGKERWPDGREAQAAVAIKWELSKRGVIVHWPLADTLALYKQ